ncbi:hypothetical protein OH77DRAFT_140970 [Trametes cingulata]|nr:hypothetical protein OH77DRAFT_140970 [Trametes cingulata]
MHRCRALASFFGLENAPSWILRSFLRSYSTSQVRRRPPTVHDTHDYYAAITPDALRDFECGLPVVQKRIRAERQAFRRRIPCRLAVKAFSRVRRPLRTENLFCSIGAPYHTDFDDRRGVQRRRGLGTPQVSAVATAHNVPRLAAIRFEIAGRHNVLSRARHKFRKV